MAVWSTPLLSTVSAAGRCDPEFFEPRFLELETRLRTACDRTIRDIADLIARRFDPSRIAQFEYVEISGIDLETGDVETTAVASADTPDRAQFQLSGGEILVSTVRPNRSAIGLVPNEVRDWVASSGFAVLRAKADVLRSFLFAWLKTKEVTDWLDRHTTASMYPAISVPDVLTTPVPTVGDDRLNAVHRLIHEYEDELRLSKNVYPEAEAELLERLDWVELTKNTPELSYTTEFFTLSRAERADAEFFHPHCRRLREQIRKVGGATIGEFCAEPSRGVQPTFDDAGTVLALDSKSVRQHGVDPSGERVSQEFYDSPFAGKARVQHGDVLLNSTGRGTLGRAAFYQLDAPAVCDNHITILHPDPTMCDARYLALFLNSPAGLTQSEQFETGSSGQLEIYPQHIKQFLIFLPRTKSGAIDLEWQKKLSAKIEAATNAREQARAKLDEARRLVEEALGL
jgi:hypothetical protein